MCVCGGGVGGWVGVLIEGGVAGRGDATTGHGGIVHEVIVGAKYYV